MANLVVIIGRPNVGKSTLFNRLVGHRIAIVHKQPGVTRDRIYGDVSWQGKVFGVVDTGGLLSADDSLFAQKIRIQISYALKEASVVILLVDGRAGPHPEDFEISRMLRKSAIPFLLAVNKTDRAQDESQANEFYGLGIEKVFPVSAEHGLGVAELLDEIVNFIPPPEKREPGSKETIRLLILGRPNVGKSTLMNNILKEERAIVDVKPGTTRDLLEAYFQHNGHAFLIVDSAGLRKKSRVKEPIEFYSVMRAINYIDRCDVVLLMVDAQEGLTSQDKKIASLVLAKRKGLIITPNKIDLLSKPDLNNLKSQILQVAPFIRSIPIITISALRGIRINQLLETAIAITQESQKWVDADLLNKLFKDLKPPQGKNRLYSLKQVNASPPVFLLVSRDRLSTEYLRYLENQVRRSFGFSGASIVIKVKVLRHR